MTEDQEERELQKDRGMAGEGGNLNVVLRGTGDLQLVREVHCKSQYGK